MSEEQLKAFIAKVQADTSRQEQLKAEGADPVAIAKAAGFSITTEDLKYRRQTLSDDDLEGAAGGFFCVQGTANRFTINVCWSNFNLWLERLYLHTQSPCISRAFYFFNDFHIHLKRHPIPGTLNLQTTTNL